MTGDLHGLPWCQRGIGLGENSIPSRLQLCDLFRIALGIGTTFQGIYLFFDLCDRIFKVECHHFRYKSPVLSEFYREGFEFVGSSVDVLRMIEDSEGMDTVHEIKKLGFLGCGNMGGAILEGILDHGELTPEEILVVERSEERTSYWRDKGVSVSKHPKALQMASTLILGVKPQIFDQAAIDLGTLERSCTVVSIMAGIDSTRISAALGEKARVVRTMPNTPCTIGMGISAIARGHNATESDMALASKIMSTVGRIIEIDEASMHAVTATSGSGPAYLFLMAESWIEASIASGLSREVAELLVVETIRGSAELLHRERDAITLRKNVTSKGGTTQAGIESLEENGLRESLVQALEAARQRGVELGSEISS